MSPPQTTPWDCDGSQCHDECHLRHLDPIEKQIQQERQSAAQPSVVVTASRDMGKTASTWVYNAVRLLYRQAQEPCDSYWVRQLHQTEVQDRIANTIQQRGDDNTQQTRHVLIKTHEWTPYTTKAEFEAVAFADPCGG
jgi:hypothetical protein